jgi:hypothetical protein
VSISRAGFLKLCGAGIVGGSLPGWQRLGGGAEVALHAAPADTWASQFRPHVGSSFAIDEVSQRVRLASIAEQPIRDGVEQFSLLFHGSAGVPILHGIYTFHHAALGRLELFITPVGAQAATPVYEACFSRHLSSKELACRINS